MADAISVRVEEDLDKRGGHAIIKVRGLAAPPSSGVRYSIRRPSEGFLKRGVGWASDEAWNEPSRIEVVDGVLRLYVGPDVVSFFEQAYVNFEFRFMADGLPAPLLTVVSWPDITPFEGDWRTEGSVVLPVKAGDQAAKTMVSLAGQTEQKTPPPEPPAERHTSGPESWSRPDEERRNSLTSDPIQPGKSSRNLAILGGVVLLAAIAGSVAVWKYMSDHKTADSDGADLPLKEWVRTHTPEQVHARAVAFQQAGNQDKALVLFEYAAAAGYGPSSTALGKMYDPANATDSPLGPNPLNAFERYKKAETQGDPEATAHLAALKGWATKKAAAGDPAARQVLEKMQ